MEVTTETRKDLPEEIVESSLPARAEYGWVAEDVRTQHSLFRWSWLLKSWLNCIPVLGRNIKRDIVTLVRAFRVLCQPLYLQPSPQSFLYFYVTRPKSPTTWRSLISRPGISRLKAFTQSFKHFKDVFFRVVVKKLGRSYFYNNDGSTKFPFSWTDNPQRYKDMKREKLLVANREVGETLMKFNDKIPIKGLVRVYLSMHPIVDLKGHMAQLGKKKLNLFQTLWKKKAAKAKSAGNTEVPNLQDPLVEVHVHEGMKRKAEVLAKQGGGKNVKKVRATLLGLGSFSGAKNPEAGLIELLETTV
ncbi:hypothetical protein DEO72_LG5g995 [Vigna unguiculata]|uniref:Uncharacterized protein n=1 Tax=Vigna unguiculata TaxID=3917 RepID=A0A4D6LY70_VIGUN|nr:hypothetical protein DEO72_LG5g995 [Vigna unguiculata]